MEAILNVRVSEACRKCFDNEVLPRPAVYIDYRKEAGIFIRFEFYYGKNKVGPVLAEASTDTFNINQYKKAKDGLGVGLHEAMRGGVAHWCVMKNSHIENYQIMAPSTWNSGPKLGENDLGPYEAAIVGSPISEAGELTGVDVVRTIRSFDPCLACSVQVFNGDKKIVHLLDI